MADITMYDLDKQLKAGKPSRVYLVYGPEVYMKQQAVNKLLAACVPKELPEFNYQRFDGTHDGFGELPEAIAQFPMMSDRRCVMMEDYDFAHAASSDVTMLVDCIKSIPACCVLIIWQNDNAGGDKSSGFKKVLDACKKNGSVLNMTQPKAGDAAKILCQNAERLGVRLSNPDAYYMTELCGADLTNLMSELEKLALIAGRKPITRELIDRYCAPTIEADVYKISRSILSGRSDDAFVMTRRLLAQKVSPVSIFNAMSGSFLDLYRAKTLARSGAGANEMTELFPGDYKGRAFRVTNAMRDQEHYSMPLLRKFVTLLFEAELELKGGRSDKAVCLEMLITKLCIAKRNG